MAELLDDPRPIPVPPMLAEAFGYEGEARYVAFWWDGDNLALADGVLTLTGGLRWYAWKLFTEHELVPPHLHGYNLGSSDGEARHRLLIDRQAGRVFVGLLPEVDRILQSQQPARPSEVSGVLRRTVRRAVRPAAPARGEEAGVRLLRDQVLERKVYEDLRAWLDRRLQ